jgi:hypothetical protein
MSAQAFAQLVSLRPHQLRAITDELESRTESMVRLLSQFRRYRTDLDLAVISYYAPLVFESAGWIGRDAILMTGINGISESSSL